MTDKVISCKRGADPPMNPMERGSQAGGLKRREYFSRRGTAAWLV